MALAPPANKSSVMSVTYNRFFASFATETRVGWMISCASVIWVVSLGVARAEDLTQQEVIRSVMPDGSVQYGDAPADGAADNQRIQLKISAPDAGAAKQAADEARARRSQLLRDADLRAARRRALDDKIVSGLPIIPRCGRRIFPTHQREGAHDGNGRSSRSSGPWAGSGLRGTGPEGPVLRVGYGARVPRGHGGACAGSTSMGSRS